MEGKGPGAHCFVPPRRYKTMGLFPPSRREKRRSRPVSRVLSWTVILLGATSPWRSSNLPGPDAGHAIRSLFGLAPGGVCRAGPLPDSRCALTAPFHPYRSLATPLRPVQSFALQISANPDFRLGRCFASPAAIHGPQWGDEELRRYLSVALSVGSRRPGVTWHLALWSPDFPRRSRRNDATVRPTPPRALYGVAPALRVLVPKFAARTPGSGFCLALPGPAQHAGRSVALRGNAVQADRPHPAAVAARL